MCLMQAVCCWLSEAGDATEWDVPNGEIHAQSKRDTWLGWEPVRMEHGS